MRKHPFNAATLVDLLQARAADRPDFTLYSFDSNGGDERLIRTYGQLASRSRALAAFLQSKVKPGDRVLLLFPPGVEYIEGFFGCLFAGVIAVPAYPPEPTRLQRSLPRLESVVHDAHPTLALSVSSVMSKLGLPDAAAEQKALLGSLATIEWVATDDLPDGWETQWQDPGAGGSTLAFLQYTSGSTRTPRGVMVSHANLLHNLATMRTGLGLSEEFGGVNWLPTFHDMGLIGGVLEPLYAGFPVIEISPLAFLQSPLRWLRAIASHGDRPVATGGPNFAYDLCVQWVDDAARATLSLEHWEVAFSGSEPVRAATLDRFAEVFASCGFRRRAFFPCYGLAEATLYVSGARHDTGPLIAHVDKKALASNRWLPVPPAAQGRQTLVGCGRVEPDQQVVLVHPERRTACAEGEVGEIWLRGPSVAQGYWNHPDETDAVFRAYRSDAGDGPYMRTGDMGIMAEGELFVAGRIKDLIIIRGRNHYPQDIEQTVESTHPSLRPNSGAAISIERDGDERLVIVQEVKPTQGLDLDAVGRAIVQAVADQHELQVDAVVMVKRGTIPKTSSGKIQRHACKKRYLDGELEIVRELRGEATAPPAPLVSPLPAEEVPAHSRGEIERWLIDHLAQLLRVRADVIDPERAFTSYGLDSAHAVTLSGNLSTWLGRPLSPTLAWDYPSVRKLAAFLGGTELQAAPAPPSAPKPGEHEPVAVVGLGLRFPGAASAAEFWHMLRDGVDAISEVPPDRWDIDELYDPSPAVPGKMSTRWGAFLKDVRSFDPEFFEISPREASRMDPQQRLILTVVWEALEHAGIDPRSLRGTRTGVFVGISANDYGLLQQGEVEGIDAYTGTGNAFSIAANRVSYAFDFRGPSIALDTACSSSLVAVHLAVQSLRRGECSHALAGGVNLMLSPELTVTFSQARMMSPTGRCRTFDASADGYVRGEGCGMVVLKTLSDAVRDGDRILAVIRGSAVNQDGRSNGITAPNRLAQVDVIRDALRDSGVAAADIQYVEAHGTGTILGDPIEIQALADIMRDRSGDAPCLVGSVKTNIGHLESAAGAAGLIKTVLSMVHDEIPPHLHLKEVNPHIPLDVLPLRIPTSRTPWPEGKRRVAGVSSFGFGGTNAHVILEEAPVLPAASTSETGEPHVLQISARSEDVLKTLATRYERILRADDCPALADVCLTARRSRSGLPHRLAVVGASPEAMADALATFTAGNTTEAVVQGLAASGPDVSRAFLYTGQGAQYPSMGRKLYHTEQVFREAIDACEEILRPHMRLPLHEVLFPASDRDAELINETEFTQPALFAIEYALTRLWAAWGVSPTHVIGHSVGEYVAACVAGVFSLEDGLRLIAARGRLMQSLPRNGAMAAVLADADTVRSQLAPWSDRVSLAGMNGPANAVISGEEAAVRELASVFETQHITVKFLKVSHAFHSPLMDPILDEFEQVARGVAFHEPSIPVVSNLTGEIAAAGQLVDPRYWRRHLREPVQFSQGIVALAGSGVRTFLEVGPHPTLLGMGRSTLSDLDAAWIASLRRDQDERRMMLTACASLYVRGEAVRWDEVEPTGTGRIVDLPLYPFQEQSYWLSPGDPTASRGRSLPPATTDRLHPLVTRRLVSPLLSDIVYEAELNLSAQKYLADHRIAGIAILPAAAMLEMVTAAARDAFRQGRVTVENLAITESLAVPAESSVKMQVAFSPLKELASEFRLFAARQDDHEQPQEATWDLIVTGSIRVDRGETAEATVQGLELESLQSTSSALEDVAGMYRTLRLRGFEYGPAFRCLERIWRRENEALGSALLRPEDRKTASSYQMHPSLLDAAFQLVAAAAETRLAGSDGSMLYLPVGVESYAVRESGTQRIWANVALRPFTSGDAGVLVADIALYSEDGARRVASVVGLQLRRLPLSALPAAVRSQIDESLYRIDWIADSQSAPKPPSGMWLVLGDRGGIGQRLSERINRGGAESILVDPPAERNTSDEIAEYLRAALQKAGSAPGRSIAGVIHCWGLDARDPESGENTDVGLLQQQTVGSVLALAQQMASPGVSEVPRLWLVTSGTQAAGDGGAVSRVFQSTQWGLARVIMLEHPELRCGCVDLEGDSTDESLAELASVLQREDGENQIAIRNGKRYVARLHRMRLESLDRGRQEEDVRLVVDTRGSLENIRLDSAPRATPAKGQVELEVMASGLNFRDVMNAMGLYPGDPGPLGGECAGRVTAVGPGVQGLSPGDEVMGIAPGTFGTHVLTVPDLLARKPASLSWAEAGGVPIAFLTAYYSLVRLAKIAPGDTVLIHAASGGVGLAAIQIARHRGADVIGTAGSEEKRAYLRSIGVRHVYDSRSLSFVDGVREATGGRGVEVVLNSLGGDFIPASLSVLARGGRFVELGKVGIWSTERVTRERDDVRYWTVALDTMSKEDPAPVQSMLQDLKALFEAGSLRALPLKEFALADAVDAFRLMARTKHIGKIVINAGVSPAAGAPARTGQVRGDASYLITGGYGALGLLVAARLADRGARHLVLAGIADPSEQALHAIRQLESRGVTVRVARVNVADRDEVAGLLRQCGGSPDAGGLPPLRGIVHAAGLLDDGVLLQQSWDRFRSVLAPKVDGAWNLHTLTRDLPIDFSVYFSSVASVLGSPGQGNYAAANAFLDALARYRSARGQRTVSVNWAPWAGLGMAVSMSPGTQGADVIGTISPVLGLQAFDEVLDADIAQIGFHPIGWKNLRTRFEGADIPPLVRDLVAADRGTPAGAPGNVPPFVAELSATPAHARKERLAEFVRGMAAKVLGRKDPQSVDVHRRFSEMGVDSLMALELKNLLDRALGIRLPATVVFTHPSIDTLAQHILQTLLRLDTGDVQTARGQTVTPGMQDVAAAGPHADGRPHDYPLSYGQRAMWFQHQVSPDSIFNLAYAARIRSGIDVSRLHKAFQTCVDRHPMLRATFHREGATLIQRIHPRQEVAFSHEDASALTEAEMEDRLRAEARHAYDLEKGPLFLVHLLTRSPNDHILMMNAHHIVVDLWSQAIITAEVAALYGAVELPPASQIDYMDFTRWQEEMLRGPEGERMWQYWKGVLSGDLPVLELPSERTRPSVQTFAGDVATVGLGPELTRELAALSEASNATLFVTLLSTFGILLHRYTGQTDIVVGAPASGRTQDAMAGVVGYFVNPVPLRLDFSEDRSFSDILRQVRERVLGALEHQDFPIQLLVEKLNPRRDASHPPLFQVMFVYQQAQQPGAEGLAGFALGSEGSRLMLGDIPLESVAVENAVAPFDVTVMMAHRNNELALSLSYRTDIFEREAIVRMLGHFRKLLEGVVRDPGARVSHINMLPEDEREELLLRRTPALTAECHETSVLDLFAERVSLNPRAPAVIESGRTVSYESIDRRSTQLARTLRRRGVRPEVLVGICMDRSTDLIVAILGVLKAGGAYVPVDPAYPPDRMRYVIEDAGLELVLTTPSGSGTVSSAAPGVVCVTVEDVGLDAEPGDPIPPDVKPENLAYVIYTSGTTGRPKGVLLTHGGLLNLARAQIREFAITPESRVLQFASFTFDASVSEVFTSIASGATLCMVDTETLMSGSALTALLQERRITTATFPPSVLKVLPDADLPALETVVSAGETCTWEAARRWSAGRRFLNAYGPTESTICATCYHAREPRDEPSVPIGTPIDNTEVFVLDSDLNPVPAGVPGQLHIAGAGIARGYHGRPDLTAEKFIPHPFSRDPGARLYRTGDTGMILSDGTIRFLGRSDDQVKIRGYRVELEEIDSVLQAHPDVAQAVTLYQAARQRLVAYYVPKHNGQSPLTPQDLRLFARGRLPDYMVPSAFLDLQAIPLTAHGKVDRKALPAEPASVMSGPADAPGNETERALLDMWKDVLQIDRVGLHDNFFDLGGHSLSLIQLQTRLQERFHVDMSVVDMFKYPTVNALAGFLTGRAGREVSGEKTAERAALQKSALARQAQRARGGSKAT